MPSLVFDVTPAPGKLKKHPGEGPLGHRDGLITDLGLAYMAIVSLKTIDMF